MGRILWIGVVALAFGCGGEAQRDDLREVSGAGVLSDLSGTNGRNHPEKVSAPYVVLVGLDGVRFDAIERPEAANLQALAARGVKAAALIPPLPSKTFPSFYTLATGVRPGRHGIVSNNFWDPDREARFSMTDPTTVQDASWYGAEPIWVTAESKGMVTASYFWVGSEAAVRGIRPSIWKPFEDGLDPFARVDSAVAWLGLPADQRPHLVTLYFNEVDNAGHFFGYDSPEMGRAIALIDSVIGGLVEGLAGLPHGDQIHLVVVSDHGIAEVSEARVTRLERSDYPRVRFEGGSEWWVAFVEGDSTEVRTTRDRLRADLPNVRVERMADFSAPHDLAASSRAGDLALMPDLGYRLIASDRNVPDRKGGHGWDPAHPEMHGIFMAAGARIRPGTILPALESVNVYPFLAELLGIEGAEVEGRLEVFEPALRPAG